MFCGTKKWPATTVENNIPIIFARILPKVAYMRHEQPNAVYRKRTLKIGYMAFGGSICRKFENVFGFANSVVFGMDIFPLKL
jgi:hypothetical protein